jgi:hypothetical protein
MLQDSVAPSNLDAASCRKDQVIWRDSAQLARFGNDVVLFEGVRVVPSILLFLTLQEQKGDDQHQRDAGGGRYKRLMDSVGAPYSQLLVSRCRGHQAAHC